MKNIKLKSIKHPQHKSWFKRIWSKCKLYFSDISSDAIEIIEIEI
jgi:hypothetical protein